MKNKKIYLIIAAVLTFFACSIFANELPIFTSLAVLIAVGAGFAIGFFYRNIKTKHWENQYWEKSAELLTAENKLLKKGE